MARAWLDERLAVLIPALSALTADQADEIERLCTEEIEAWRARPEIKKPGSLHPIMTAARKVIRERIKLTPENRHKNERTGQYEHIALKYLTFSKEEWNALNAISDEKFQARLESQQLIDQPAAVVARAEKLLHSNRWDELVTGLALATGRRLSELLKSGRFFPVSESAYILTFDGQLKRRDFALKPYEIPTLVSAELVLSAWRRLRSLEDTGKLDNEQVAQKYSKVASETANREFTGLIPQRSTREDLYTHAFRAVYARIAVLYYCPVTLNDLVYVNTILGHSQADTEQKRRDYAATMHYFDYRIGDSQGQIDGRQGIRLAEPGVQVIAAFRQQPKGDQTDMTSTDTQEQTTALETRPVKTRGTLTLKIGTYDQATHLIEERRMQGTGAHDRLLVDLMAHDATAHQMYSLLAQVAPVLGQDAEENPIATLQALVAAYRAGGSSAAPGMSDLLQSVSDQAEPVSYLKGLVERDRSFKKAIAGRHAGTDYTALSMSQLMSIKTPEAATERIKRGVDAIIRHNEAQTDPLHFWFINSPAVRALVGGRNDAVMAYLATRQQELDEHHAKYSLTARQNSKNAKIEDEIIIEAGWTRPKGKPRKPGQAAEDDDE